MRTFDKSARTEIAAVSGQDLLDIVEKFGCVGYWRINLHSNRIFLSPEVCRIHGMPSGYRPENIDECVAWYHEDDREIVAATVSEATSNGEQFFFEARIVSANKDVRWVAVNGEAQTGDNGKNIAIYGTLVDITAERNMNLRLGQALREAQNARRLKEMFLANMNHELRTPLNAIIGFSQVIKMMQKGDEANETIFEYASNIETAGGHLLSLIEDIFCLAKIEADADTVSMAQVDIETLLDDVRSLTGTHARKNDQQISFDCTIPHTVSLIADQSKLSQLLVYLVSNAIKRSPPSIPVRVHACLGECGRLFLNVTDAGVRISEDQHDKIFERFERMDPSDRSVESITVGLTLAREMVSKMNGEIGISSSENSETTFWISFPVLEADAPVIMAKAV